VASRLGSGRGANKLKYIKNFFIGYCVALKIKYIKISIVRTCPEKELFKSFYLSLYFQVSSPGQYISNSC